MLESTYHPLGEHLCCGDEGEFVAETRLSSDGQEIIAYLGGLWQDIDVVGLEAGTIAQYLADGLQAAGLKAAGMEARQVRVALSVLRNKLDLLNYSHSIVAGGLPEMS